MDPSPTTTPNHLTSWSLSRSPSGPRRATSAWNAPVRGGQYGEPPNLTDLDDGDLKFTTDFRDVYGTLLAGVLETEPARVLDGWTGTMPRLLR